MSSSSSTGGGAAAFSSRFDDLAGGIGDLGREGPAIGSVLTSAVDGSTGLTFFFFFFLFSPVDDTSSALAVIDLNYLISYFTQWT